MSFDQVIRPSSTKEPRFKFKFPTFYKKKFNQLLFVTILTFGVVAGVVLIEQKQLLRKEAASARNNVLVFMMDDLDEDSFNQLLNAGKLPNIKQYIVDKGVRFTNSFVTESICCSSRATFLTGKYSHNTGVYNVVGDEGGMLGLAKTGIISTSGNQVTSANWLPTWLDSLGYYTGHVGKFMNTFPYGNNKKPGFDYWRNVSGYDARPGMYYVWADDNTTAFNPDIFQIKYIGDKSIEFLNNFVTTSGSQNFFLEVTPHAPHIFKVRWTEDTNGAFDATVSDPANRIVTFNVFDPPQTDVDLRKQVTKLNADGTYSLYALDHKATGWGSWYVAGNPNSFSGTNNLPIVAFNAFIHPDINNIRQHVIRGDTTQGYSIFHRDMANGAFGAWISDGTVAQTMPNTGNLPVVGFSVTDLPNKGILQYLLRGTQADGYELWHRARVNNVFSNWVKEPEQWDIDTGGNPIEGFDVDYVGNGLIDMRIVRRSPNTGKYTVYSQRIRSFYADIPQQMVLGASSDNMLGVSTYLDEADLFSPNYGQVTGSTTLPGMIFASRLYADGNWPNVKSTQTYDKTLYGGSYPAGSLRLNGDSNGFVPVSSQYDLPRRQLASFNNPGCGSKHTFICTYWPDLNQQVIGGKTQLDYLRRSHLDRLESMLSIDVMVGQVMSQLQTKGLLSNTMVIFTSDNGYLEGDYRLGNKQFAYEPSIRVPLIIRSPGSTLTAGRTNKNTVVNFDMTATIMDYSGVDWTSSTYSLDGRSLKPILTNPVDQYSPWRKWFLVEFHYPRNFDVRTWIQAWAVPDIQALRTGVEATISEGNNQAYIEYTDDPLVQNEPPFYEYYDLNTDSVEVANKFNNNTATVDPNYQSKLTLYRLLVPLLKSCKGANCRSADIVNPIPTSTPVPTAIITPTVLPTAVPTTVSTSTPTTYPTLSPTKVVQPTGTTCLSPRTDPHLVANPPGSGKCAQVSGCGLNEASCLQGF